MTQQHPFKRLLVGLHTHVPAPALDVAAELADLLQVDLVGLFLQDRALRDLMHIPFARELRLFGGGWHPINPDEFASELEIRLRVTERLFTGAVKQRTTRCRFEVVHGETAEALLALSQADDIVVLVAPASPVERATQQFTGLLDAAFQSHGSVMIMPPAIARRSGPIAAMAAIPDDASVSFAAMLAQAAKEDLVILEAARSAPDTAPPTGSGGAVRHLALAELARAEPGALARALLHLHERLIVLSRGALAAEDAIALSVLRRVPVLLFDGARAAADRGAPQGE